MIVTCRQMQQTENAAFESGVLAADLMEQAGIGIARCITQFCPTPGTALLYLGTGNNAGDALLAGRELHQKGWRIIARLTAPSETLKPLPRQHHDALGSALHHLTHPPETPDLPPGPLILIDGLLGIGASPPLRDRTRDLTREMNFLRQTQHAQVFALDLPSGLHGDTGEPDPDTVRADVTITIAQVKRGLVADAATGHVGRIAIVPLQALTSALNDDTGDILTACRLRSQLPPRSFDTHKGQAGRVGILAGAPGYYGAAELCCRGALASGAGLVTLYTLPSAYQVLASRLPAEVMVKKIRDYREVLHARHDSLAVGPGLALSPDHEASLLEVLASSPTPAVLDAEGLNLLARQPDLSDRLTSSAGPRLLTPHPGEWQRLRQTLEMPSADRLSESQAFVTAFPTTTLLLKGARTLITQAGHPPLWNTTGHPGMATGGMGDVLTGCLAAFLGQGLSPGAAASLGAWLCGRAAEIDSQQGSELSTLPSGVIAALPQAFRDLNRGSF